MLPAHSACGQVPWCVLEGARGGANAVPGNLLVVFEFAVDTCEEPGLLPP